MFESDGKQHSITFTHQPIGLNFHPRLPLVVKTSSNAALEKGVQEGWVVKSLDGFKCSDSGMTFNEVFLRLQRCIDKLPMNDAFKEKLEIGFESNGGQQSVSFVHRPLGLTFRPGFPLVVATTNHPSVQPGWVVKSINGANISESAMTHLQVIQHINNLVQHLPLAMKKELKMIFESKGDEHPAVFRKKPLGLTFSQGRPLVVETVSGDAALQGVEVGWVLKSINGVDFSKPEGSGNLDQLKFLHDEMQ
jgi:hypothetical protein